MGGWAHCVVAGGVGGDKNELQAARVVRGKLGPPVDELLRRGAAHRQHHRDRRKLRVPDRLAVAEIAGA